MTNDNEHGEGVREAGDAGFTDPDLQEQSDAAEELSEAKAQMTEKLNASMRAKLTEALAELDAGTLHGLAIVRVNQDHEVAGGYSVCGEAARVMGKKLQSMSMELTLPPEVVREIRQISSLFSALMR